MVYSRAWNLPVPSVPSVPSAAVVVVLLPSVVLLLVPQTVNEQEYHKAKLFLLVVALSDKADPKSALVHNVSVYVGGGKMA